MQARCFCPEHGKQDFDGIVIKAGVPMCVKCMKPLEYGKVMPRPVLAKPAAGKPAPKPKAKARSNKKK
jgi:hypothetical protein